MQSQDKAMNLTWLAPRGGGSGCKRFQGTKKRPDIGKYLNSIVTSTVKEPPKQNKCLKAKAENEFGSEEEQENFNFEHLKIGEE